MKRALFAGGYGLVGGHAARAFRAISTDVEIIIAGRRRDAGEALAREIGRASVIVLDAENPAPGLDAAGPIDLVVSTLTDSGDRIAFSAIERGIAHLGITRTPQDVAPLLVAASQPNSKAPVAIFGHWQAGALALAAMDLAAGMTDIEAVHLAAIYDPEDPIGPTARADAAAFANRALVRSAGCWTFLGGDEHPAEVVFPDGSTFSGRPTDVLDVPTLAVATGSPVVRFDLGIGVSLGRRRGHSASHDLLIEISGREPSGGQTRRTRTLSAPLGQGWLTGFMVALAAQRLLDLDRLGPVPPGPVWPETLLDPATTVHRLCQAGVELKDQFIPTLTDVHS
jgi:hypothetical protein